jgi:hypothetical protein
MCAVIPGRSWLERQISGPVTLATFVLLWRLLALDHPKLAIE